MRPFHAFVLIAATCVTSTAVARNFQAPVEWASSGGATVDVAATYVGASLIEAGDGRLLWFGGESGTTAAYLSMRPGQTPVFGQFGEASGSNRLVVEQVLAADATTALLRVREVGFSSGQFVRRMLVVIDLGDGGVRWAIPLDVEDAVLVADGDVLARTRRYLLRLAPGGEPRWAVALDIHFDRGIDTSVTALLAAESRALLVVGRNRPGASTALRPMIMGFNLDDGSLSWKETVVAASATGTCERAVLGNSLVVVSRGTSPNGSNTLVVERRSPTSGALLTATPIPAIGTDSGCRLLDVSGTTLLATSDIDDGQSLSAIDSDGQLRWHDVDEANGRLAITRVPATDDFLYLASSLEAPVRAQRRSVADGTLAWSTTLPQSFDGARFAVAASAQVGLFVGATNGAITLSELSMGDGALVQERSVAVPQRILLPYDARFVDDVPFDAAAASDGGIQVRRLDPDGGSSVSWSRTAAGFPDPTQSPQSITLGGAGPEQLFVLADYRLGDAILPRRGQVLLRIDRATGDIVHRREIGGADDQRVSVLAAGTDGTLIRLTLCVSIGCASGLTELARLNAVDGNTAWQRQATTFLASLVGGDALAFVYGSGSQRGWQRLDAASGTPLWVQSPDSTTFAQSVVSAPNGRFYAANAVSDGGVPRVDTERRRLSDGQQEWSVRAGLVGDRVSNPSVRTAVNGMPLLAADLVGTEAGQQNLTRPLLDLIDGTTGAVTFRLRPFISGDRWWRLTPLPVNSGSARWQPLRSSRYLESADEPFNNRIALAFLDLETGVLGGEHLVERRFDDALLGPVAPDLVAVMPDGRILARERRLGLDGLRRPTLLRLAAPSQSGGDLQLRLLDADQSVLGFGPSRRIRVEVDNLGVTDATDAVVGVAPRRDVLDPVHAVFAACSVISGSGTCPVDPVQPRVTLTAGSTLRLEWEVYDGSYSGGPPQGRPDVAGARIFIDAPWDYADIEPGNNVIQFSLRLGAFGDGFE